MSWRNELVRGNVTSTMFFFFALVFHVWEMFLSVFQPQQAHESPLWRQTLPVRVLHEGKWALPRAPFACPWMRTWSVKPSFSRVLAASPIPVPTPKRTHVCLRWSDTIRCCQLGRLGHVQCNNPRLIRTWWLQTGLFGYITDTNMLPIHLARGASATCSLIHIIERVEL